MGDFDLCLSLQALGEAELAPMMPENVRILAANVGGLIPWITAIIPPNGWPVRSPMGVQFGSADRGRPSNYHYSAAKAALTALCGVLLRCYGKPFAVRIIKLVLWQMTVGKAPLALCASPERVARDLLRRPRRGIEYLPCWWSPLMRLIRVLPAPIASKL